MAPVPRHPYTKATLLAAIQAVNDGSMTLNGASKAFGIPYATLGDKVRGRRPINPQPRTLLNREEELKLVEWLKECARRGFGKSKHDIKDTVKAILDARQAVTSSPDNRPSKQWIKDFFKRNPDLSQRTPSALGKERALVTPDGLAAWFQGMKAYLDSVDSTLITSPDRLYNADETGFHLCPKPPKVIAEKGSKHVYNLSSNTKQSITVLACCSATGHYIEPFIIFPYKRRPAFDLMAGFPEAKFQISPNGWINADVFMSWLRDCYVPAVAHKKKPVVLFVDGHTSHTSNIEVIDICIKEQILLYCLKSHASHIIQPLDQSLFGAMKQAWGEQCQKVMNETGESVSVRTFTSALKPVWDATTRPEVAFNGFAKSGIYPYNPERAVHSNKLAPSRTFAAGAVSVGLATAPSPAAATAPSPAAATAPPAASRVPPPPPPASTTAPPLPPPPAMPSASAASMKRLLDFAALAGPEKVDSLWSALGSGAGGIAEQELKELLSGVGFYATGAPEPAVPVIQSSAALSAPPPTATHTPAPPSAPTPPAIATPATQAPAPPSAPTPPVTATSVTQAPAPAAASGTIVKSIDNILSLPQFPKNKNGGRNPPKSLPMALSGIEFRQHLLQKEREKEEIELAKEVRKAEREENRKRKLQEAEEKKKRVEETKRLRQQKKEEKEAEKKRKAEERRLKQLKATQAMDSDSDDDGDDVQYDDESEVEMDQDNLCKGCKRDSDGVWVQCSLCDGWWHQRCTMDSVIMQMEASELEAVDFYCSHPPCV